MAVLEEIVRNLLVVVIIASFFEILIPDGNTKPFVRFAIGLFILITILRPALSYLYDNRDFKVDLWDYQVDQLKQEEILENGYEVSRKITEGTSSQLKTKVEGQIGAVAMLVEGVEEVDVKADMNEDGSIRKLTLMVNPGEGTAGQENAEHIKAFSGNQDKILAERKEQIRNKITTVLRNLYGLDKSAVEINFEGG
ncbi:MAG: stage III sporulation protein AF [Syntrophomonadaceae bacterium]|jgi:stage III sporulation protein AF